MSEYIVEENPYPTFKLDGYSVCCDDWLIQHEEIVRCGDCKFYRFDHGGTCEKIVKYPIIAHVEPDGFCSWGERSEE